MQIYMRAVLFRPAIEYHSASKPTRGFLCSWRGRISCRKRYTIVPEDMTVVWTM